MRPPPESSLPRGPPALLPDGLAVLQRWGFTYKTNLVWYQGDEEGEADAQGAGLCFRTVTELVLFGVRGRLRTGAPGRRQVNIIVQPRRKPSCLPDELYRIMEACSPGPYLELFAHSPRVGWSQWGDEVATHEHGQVELEDHQAPPIERVVFAQGRLF